MADHATLVSRLAGTTLPASWPRCCRFISAAVVTLLGLGLTLKSLGVEMVPFG